MMVLLGCAGGMLTIEGEVVDVDGDVHVEVVDAAVWSGQADNDGADVSVDTDGPFSFEVDPGSWVVVAARGTCSTVEPVEGDAGERVELSLTLDCVE